MTDENTETEDQADEPDRERSQYGGRPEEADAVEQTETREEDVEPPEDESEEGDGGEA